MSGAHLINYERKKSGAHVFLEERVMSAKLSKERKKSAEDKFFSENLKKHYFTFSMFFNISFIAVFSSFL